MSEETLIGLVKKGIEIYNERRYPEAVAELLEIRNDIIVVKFSGSFCMWCGIYDWVEDLVYVFKEVGLETVLMEYVEPEDPTEPLRFGYFKIISKV
ncbi:MAG: hypothetical protein QN229_07080 [Desulfurococcaceae archaeon TW002]